LLPLDCGKRHREGLEGPRDALAGEVVGASARVLAKGASDLTRAVDAAVVSERVATLSQAVGVAGVVDMSQGVEMLASSEDVNVMSALVGLMSLEDVDHGLELARMAGEFSVVSQIVAPLQMPLLTAFLEERSISLHAMAVEQVRQAGSTRSLARAIAATGKQIAGLGENEIAEGVARLAVSEGMAVRSEQRLLQ
jgi:hypothetical protein